MPSSLKNVELERHFSREKCVELADLFSSAFKKVTSLEFIEALDKTVEATGDNINSVSLALVRGDDKALQYFKSTALNELEQRNPMARKALLKIMSEHG